MSSSGGAVFDLTRDSPFGYTCNRCRRCCHDKRIKVNPYEVLRLARRRGVTTGEFLERFTDEGGTVLRFDPESRACSFLGDEGCAVHPDRPLVCRLYPLGRYSAGAGAVELFTRMEPVAGSEGVYADPAAAAGTVGEFLDGQGVAPFIAASARYYALFQRLAAAQEAVAAGGGREAPGPDGGPADVPNWLDVDAVVAAYCAANGLAVPDDVEETATLHIRALEAWADALVARRSSAAPSS